MPKRFYYDPDTDQRISRKSLRTSDRDTQIRVMRDWFTDNFEEPVMHTPYESAEGGYIYIWGGPYDPEDELEAEFSGVVDPMTLQELVADLRQVSTEWTRSPRRATFDAHLSMAVTENTRFLETFAEAVSTIERLLMQPMDSSLQQAYYRMLYAGVITALETYLSDAFINTALTHRRFIQRLMKTDPELAKRSVLLRDLFERVSRVKDEMKAYLLDLVWHNIAKVNALYAGTLKVTFGPEMEVIARAISLRHDIVHRNGSARDGTVVVISEGTVRDLLSTTQAFVTNIDAALPRSRRARSHPPEMDAIGSTLE